MRRHSRRGTMLFETTVAFGILVVVLSFVGQAWPRLARVQRLIHERHFATEALRDQLWRLSGTSPTEANDEFKVELPDEVLKAIPNATCICHYSAIDNGFMLNGRITWNGNGPGVTYRVALETWVPAARAIEEGER